MSDWSSDFKVSTSNEHEDAPSFQTTPDGFFRLSIPFWLIGSLIAGAFIGLRPFEEHAAHRGTWADALLWACIVAAMSFGLRKWRRRRHGR
jgi:hypothetical protein